MKILKRVMPCLVMVLCLFGMTACGEDPRTQDYNGYSYDDLQDACRNTALTLEQISPEEAQAYLESGSETTAHLVTSWMENRPELGDFLGFGEFEVTKSGKTLTAAQTLNYTVRPMVLTYVFKANTMEVTDITVDLVYTTGEKMGKAGLNTVLCISVVFAVLIVISLIIAAFKLIPKIQGAFAKKEAPAEVKSPDFVEQVRERETITDDTALIAVIAAAIAMDTGTSPDGFVVRSIKRR